MFKHIDSLLWSISRAYRRRKIRQSRVYTELLSPIRPDAEALDRALERPAILTRMRDFRTVPRSMQPWPNELLVEKLTDEAMMHGSWPIGREYYCEHCPQYGHCSICGQDHVGGGAA
jgi:hypothetical protein